MKTRLWFAALAALALPSLVLAEECPSKTTCAEGMVWDLTKAQCVLKPTS
ncbi:hypothetical protein [Neotabrizicola sp. VNH66]